jgi:hypothetical protein
MRCIAKPQQWLPRVNAAWLDLLTVEYPQDRMGYTKNDYNPWCPKSKSLSHINLQIFSPFFEASSPEAIVYTKEVVEDLFKQLDLNGDGKVTSDEFSKKEVDTAIAKASRAAHADDR